MWYVYEILEIIVTSLFGIIICQYIIYIIIIHYARFRLKDISPYDLLQINCVVYPAHR